jgi:hypothetical protein
MPYVPLPPYFYHYFSHVDFFPSSCTMGLLEHRVALSVGDRWVRQCIYPPVSVTRRVPYRTSSSCMAVSPASCLHAPRMFWRTPFCSRSKSGYGHNNTLLSGGCSGCGSHYHILWYIRSRNVANYSMRPWKWQPALHGRKCKCSTKTSLDQAFRGSNGGETEHQCISRRW